MKAVPAAKAKGNVLEMNFTESVGRKGQVQ